MFNLWPTACTASIVGIGMVPNSADVRNGLWPMDAVDALNANVDAARARVSAAAAALGQHHGVRGNVTPIM